MKNEGALDRALRVIVGIVLLSLVMVRPKTMWGLVGLVPLLTGMRGFLSTVQGFRMEELPAGTQVMVHTLSSKLIMRRLH